MKRFRRLSAFVMVLTLLVSLSINVWAADYDAANMDDLWSAFNDLSGEDVNINLTTDIDGYDPATDGYNGVTGQDGINYNISSENDSSLSNIFFSGGESITVNTDISGMTIFDNTNATVNGAIDGEVGAYEATIEINGNVGGYVNAYEATVEINGNVDGYVNAGTNSTVDVSGNVDYAQAYDNGILNVAGDVNDGLWAANEATIDVGGDVNGTDGNPDDVDMSDPYSYSDGATAIVAMDNATVNVGGDVTGGDSYGTYGWAGSGIQTMGEATVSVAGNVTGGNVTADPETVTDEINSMAGTAVQTSNSATVTIGGDVTGGSTNGSNGIAGNGIVIFCEESESETGSVAVAGAVSSGEGEYEGTGIVVDKFTEDAEIPEISAGSCDSISGNGLTDEEFEQLVSDIEATYTKTYTIVDHFGNILWQISNAKAGDELTIDMYHYWYILTEIIEAAMDADIKLIIKWNGGEDLVIDKTFSAEIEGKTIEMAKLAELLKK